MKAQKWLAVAALMMALAVALGAFGAHGLKKLLTAEQLAIWQTAVHYHVINALALLAISLFAMTHEHRCLRWVMTGIVLGVLLFSGSLYVWALTGISWLVFITPIGGLVWILTWLWLSWYALRQPLRPSKPS